MAGTCHEGRIFEEEIVNIKVILAGAVLLGAGSAHAFEYRSDSGDSQNSLGVTGGGQIAWWQQFTVNGADSMITAIQLTFGLTLTGFPSNTPANAPFTVYVWKGTPTGAGVDTPTLLASAAGTVSAGSIDTDVFQTVAINANITGTSNFFIGASMNHGSGVTPASLQQTGTGSFPILNNSWVGAYAANGFNPNNFGVQNTDFFRNSDIGFSGNWLIRAQASPVPEPATMATLAAAMGALALRRRKRSK